MLVYTFATDSIKEYADISEKINKLYCSRHGYEWKKESTLTLDSNSWDPHWEKVAMTQRLLKKRKHKKLFWIDADAAFNQHDIKLDHFFALAPKSDILICYDGLNKEHQDDYKNSVYVNTGTILFKNTDWTRRFVDSWIKNAGSYRKGSPLQDQDKFVDMLASDHMKCMSLKKIGIFPINAFNSPYARSLGNHFIIHLMKKSIKNRVEGFRNILNRLETNNNTMVIKNQQPNDIVDMAYNTRSKAIRSKLAIVTMYDDPIKSYAMYSNAITQMYGFKHNYEVITIRDRLSDRDPQWDKVYAVWKVLEKEDHDYVVWIDSDATFQDHNKRILEDIINKNMDEKQFLICDDIINKSSGYKGFYVNTGSFIFKNSDWSRNFCKTWWNSPMGKEKKRYHEQDVLTIFYNENKHYLKENIIVVPHDIMNSAFKELPSFITLSGGRRDTFVIHMMARNRTDRNKFFKDMYYQKSKNIEMHENYFPDGFITELSKQEETNKLNHNYMIITIAMISLFFIVAILFLYLKNKKKPIK